MCEAHYRTLKLVILERLDKRVRTHNVRKWSGFLCDVRCVSDVRGVRSNACIVDPLDQNFFGASCAVSKVSNFGIGHEGNKLQAQALRCTLTDRPYARIRTRAFIDALHTHAAH
eukprot:4658754-Pleurochrysis_carterae.AAC.1